jgi:hypothetical protein
MRSRRQAAIAPPFRSSADLMMRAADAAIYSRTLKFSLVTEDSKNSARPCRAEIFNRGDGADQRAATS